MSGDESVEVSQQARAISFSSKTKTILIAYRITQIISKSIGQQQYESSQNIELGNLSPPSTFATQSASIPSSSDVGESTQGSAPYRAEPRRRGLLDGVSDPQVRKILQSFG